jgi:hypothetical protein
MDYYQGIVTEYLRANRSTFVNTEFCLQVNENDYPDKGKPYWYVDALAVELRDPSKTFLCEITYAKQPNRLITRLREWQAHWPEIRIALERDAHIPSKWEVRPWLFVPEGYVSTLTQKLSPLLEKPGNMLPIPRITTLEMTQPWCYREWNRIGEKEKPGTVPPEMQE